MYVDVLTIGEILVEIMTKKIDQDFFSPGELIGPFPSGAPAIFIDQVVRLGLKGGIIGSIGKDDFGMNVFERLKKDKVDTSNIKIMPNFTTGTAFVTYFSNGDRKFIFHLTHSAAAQIGPDDIKEEDVANVRCLHIMGCSLSVSESMRQAIEKAIEIAFDSEVLISFDPNIRSELGNSETFRVYVEKILPKCKIVLSGEKELLTITGEKDIKKAVKFLQNVGISVIVIKKGKGGAEAFYNNELYKVAPFKVEEVDPTGAGDCFDAAFIASILEGYSVPEALKRANIVGALSVTKKGPMEGTVWKDELIARLRDIEQNK